MVREILSSPTYEVMETHTLVSSPGDISGDPSSSCIKKCDMAIVEAPLLARVGSRQASLNTINLGVLDLSRRAFTRLRTANISTVGQLINCTENYLLNIPHVGVTTVNEIKWKLNAYLTKVLDKDGPDSRTTDVPTIAGKITNPLAQEEASSTLFKFIGKLSGQFGHRRRSG